MTELNNKSIDKMFVIGGGFCVIGALITMGVWFVLYGGIEPRITTVNYPEANETLTIAGLVEKSIIEVKEMNLLELAELKETILDFKELKTDFEIDVTGFLDVFK